MWLGPTLRFPYIYPIRFSASHINKKVKKHCVRVRFFAHDIPDPFLRRLVGAAVYLQAAAVRQSSFDGKVFRPEKQLKGFQKVFLKAGEKKRVSIAFDDKTFRYWNVRTNRYEVESGDYQILVGACVLDIRLSGSINLEGSSADLPYEGTLMPSYQTGFIQDVGKEEYEALLGYPIPYDRWDGELEPNDAVCQMYYAKSGLARLIYRILTDKKNKNEAAGTPDLNLLFQYNIPFRAIAKMTGGMVSMDMVQGMLLVVNGHFFKETKEIIKGFLVNERENRRYEKLLGREE